MQADPVKPVTRELYYFGIKRRAWATDRLDIKLKKLAIASLLCAGVPKHRSQEIEARRLGASIQAVLEVRPDHAGSSLSSQRNLPVAAVSASVHLFREVIAAQAVSLDQFGRLHNRRA